VVYDNKTRSPIDITGVAEQQRREADRQGAAAEQQAREQRQQQREETLASLNETRQQLEQANAQLRGGYSGGQNQAETSGGSSSGGHMASNPDAARRNYTNMEDAVRQNIRNIENAKRRGDSAAVKQYEDDLASNQRKMREHRQEAQSQGVNIRQSEWETKRP